jgi:ADP-ribose pyrophosphatase YjhB (NUDIX family)
MNYVGWIRSFVGKEPVVLVAAGVVVRDRNGGILLQKRSDDGFWGIPGGAMEPPESLEDTAHREVKEETGAEVDNLRLLTVMSGKQMFWEYPNGDQAHLVSVIYEADMIGGRLVVDGKETADLGFFPVTNLPWPMRAMWRRFLEGLPPQNS